MSVLDADAGPRSGTGRRVASLFASVLLGALLALLFLRSAQIAVGIPPSFDGAMNLQVASSIAKGDGYRRDYAGREAFPHEIQTGPPYILPAAAVFKLRGVGIPQSEVVNIAYLALLLAAVYALVARLGGRALGLFAACTAVLVPGIHQFGFFGYGEVPALALALTATAVYFRKGGGWRTGAAAGVLLAFAVYTKTVMLIGAGALGLCALLELASGWRSPESRRSARFAGLVVGGLWVVVAMEVWRALALGGAHAWKFWWHAETRSIFMQAGVRPGLGGQTQSLLQKFGVHFSLLGHDYRMSLIFVGLWLALVFAALGWLLFHAWRQRRTDWPTLAVLLIATVYLAWWLLVTPTSKAWHRRIIDGMIAADVGMVMLAAVWFNAMRGSRPASARRLAFVLGTVVALALPAMWLVKGAHALLVAPADAKTCGWYMADPTACARLNHDTSTQALLQVASEVRALPANAYVFGFGWYSAPRIGLLAQRHILDFHDVPVASLQPSRPVYFVQGSDTPPESLQRIRTLYDVTPSQDYAYALIHAISLTPRPLVAGATPVLRYVSAADDYAYLKGFNQSEGENGRWLTDDNQVLLKPEPGDRFELAAYVLPADRYERGRAPRVLVSFDDCAAPVQQARPDQVDRLVFPIPASCHIPAGKPVSVRIEVDNLVDSAITRDARALGVLAKSFGFVAPTASVPPVKQ